MRALAFALVLLLAASGCVTPTPTTGPTSGQPTKAPMPPTVTDENRLLVHVAQGDVAVPVVSLPDAYGGVFQLATVATTFQGAEPSLGVTKNGWIFATAGPLVVRSQDGGTTWQEVHHPDTTEDHDPMLWVDPVTDRIFASHIDPAATCRTIYVSDDQGATWEPQTCITMSAPGRLDHQKLATGPFAGPQAGAAGSGPYRQLVTLCYSNTTATHCAASYDGAKTFLEATNVDGLPVEIPAAGPLVGDCGGVNGHQRHAPDGTIFVPYGVRCTQSRIAVSTDGGLTWTRHTLGPEQLEYDPAVAVTPDGMAYYVYRGQDQRVHMLRSHDRFATVEGPFIVSAPDVQGTVFTAVAAGSDGRIAIAYLGNNASAAGPDLVPQGTRWNLYFTMSLDAEAASPTFGTAQVNPQGDPIQRGTICHKQKCGNDDRNLQEFIDLEPGPDGRPWISYTDGCTSAVCKSSGPIDLTESRDQAVSVAWMKTGPSLIRDRGRLGAP